MHSPLDSPGFRDALVILGAAGVVIPAFARLRISPVIGFILVGVLVGPSGLGRYAAEHPWLIWITIEDAPAIQPFAEFGIVLLLFSIGLELSFRRLWTMRREVFGVGSGELLISALLIGALLYAWGQGLAGSVALGLALALSSTALVLQLTGTTGRVGRWALAMLLFEDVAIVPIIFLLGALAPEAAGAQLGLTATIALGVATIAAMLLFGRFFLPRLFTQAARAKSPELFFAASLLVVIVASLLTTAVGLSPLMGALLAGILIAETPYGGEVEAVTAPLKGLALGVFLLTIGMSLDLGRLAEDWADVLLAVVGVGLIKIAVTTGLLRLAGARPGVAAEAGFVLASPSETTLIVLSAALAAGLIGADDAAFWQAVTAVGLTVTPAFAQIGRAAARRVEAGEVGTTEPVPPSATVVIGFGRVGRMVADMLARHGKPYVAVDADIDTVTAARREGWHVIFGDAGRPEFLDRLRLGHAAALVLTSDDPAGNAAITRRVRAWAPDLTVVVRARDAGHAAELYRAGATEAVPETLESSLQLSEAVLTELGVAVGPVIASIHERRAELRREIMHAGELAVEPSIGNRRRLSDS